ncbi:MAG: cytochrome c biogenesis protein CcsA [Candidatus Hydrothermarchaeales archaeon]
MKIERKYMLALIAFLYVLMLFGMYRALTLGPLDPSKVPGFPRYEGDPMEHGYKIFFFSMQFGVLTYIAFFVTLVCSVLFLKNRDLKFDTIASNSAKLALVFSSIVLINGAIFSNLAWSLPGSSAYWIWEPKQTTTLILWFVLVSYLALRATVDDEDTRARLSAVIGIFGFSAAPLTLLSTIIYGAKSMHPAGFGQEAFQLDPQGRTVFGIMIFGALILYAILLWLSVKIENLEKAVA